FFYTKPVLIESSVKTQFTFSRKDCECMPATTC
ncbi:MAG: hypothetical protein ACI85U_001818, partial [Candidatus Promineifilaceae bacterium]